MRRKMRRLTLLAVLAIVATGLPAIAEARVDVDIGIGVPGPRYYRPHYYAPHYYAPPPVYYYPPPAVVYAPPPPIVYTPAPPPPPGAQANCRTYNGDATLDGRGTPFYGTACLQPDGRWHIVN